MSVPVPGGRTVIDANEAVARVAHLLSEVIAIYPITPASIMGEAADEWSAHGQTNLWGVVPEVIEMQSEAGAAGTLHGAVTRGALGTTFTASQGLLLMLPNLFKIAGELTPAVVHVAARTIATHALSIFGDHSDVMAARTTGMALLAASSVQEAADFAAVAHATTLESRVPFLNFFDGFRTSHELNTVDLLTIEQIRSLIDERWVTAHRGRGLDPDHPVLRGSAQNPDVFFQAREACNTFYDTLPATVQTTFDKVAALTGRAYHLVDYYGAPDADRVVVLMGSAVGATRQCVDRLNAAGEKVGYAVIRLYRPFPATELIAALPPTVRRIAVLDRTKEPGATGEPLLLDVLASLADFAGDRFGDRLPKVTGGRYGLSSKEFTPAMAKAVFDDIGSNESHRRFTVGIVDDVTRLSLPWDPSFDADDARVRAVFYGLGSDGTVGANKNTAKIVGELAGLNAQGYFVYDSKKSGSVTISHLRFDPEPIQSSYLIDNATFVGVHQWTLLRRLDVLRLAARGATVLLDCPWSPAEVWDRLPVEAQRALVDKGLRLFVIDAQKVAREAGLGNRINTVMQACFFELTNTIPMSEAIGAMKDAIAKTYGKRGPVVVERNQLAIDVALRALAEVPVPASVTATTGLHAAVPANAPDFVQRVTALMLSGDGDLLPVSAMPVDGTFPTNTAWVEKRSIAPEIPIWETDLCIDCGKCTIVCPHAAIRMKVFEPDSLGTDSVLPSKSFRSCELPGLSLTIQVAPDDCTGCGVCVQACPAHDKSSVKRKAINMQPIGEHLDVERERWDAFLALQSADVRSWAPDSVKSSQVRAPLFEFSGACSGCGETPYLKLLSQLFGDRIMIANATGCSSIYGGNLPTTPWSTNADGCGPAWSNSLFEDNAEFGLGIRLAYEHQRQTALTLLARFDGRVGTVGAELVAHADDSSEIGIDDQRGRVAALRLVLEPLAAAGDADARSLLDLAGTLVRKSVWIVGGDGWAYDIGYGGLDHVLGSGRNVNILVLDTEVYSNTGGQASKATPRGAVAKFAAGGRRVLKKDLGLEAMAYGDVYVAHIALGSSDVQTVKALLEADAHPGPSIIIAYSTCIAHGIDMQQSMEHQKLAVASGHWPLYRYRPGVEEHERPFQLDSRPPTMPFADFARREGRFAMLERSSPDRAAELFALAQRDVDERWRYYEQLAGIERTAPGHAGDAGPIAEGDDA